jgi:cytochrome P450
MPNSFDLDRDPPHNLMFGYGPHLCAGAELARVQVRVAVGRLLERTKHLELGVAEESLSFWPQINLHRLKALPLRFTAA